MYAGPPDTDLVSSKSSQLTTALTAGATSQRLPQRARCAARREVVHVGPDARASGSGDKCARKPPSAQGGADQGHHSSPHATYDVRPPYSAWDTSGYQVLRYHLFSESRCHS
jgi:hypothetical protein